MEAEMAWRPAGEGAVRQIMGYDGQMMMVKIRFEKGAVGTTHQHYHTQTTFVVSGRFEYHVGNEKKILGPGDGMYVAPELPHGCTCLEAGVVIDCFSPIRMDFLP